MSIYSPSDQSSPQVQERGSLRTLGEGRSQFIGSSTGVYFVNTVRRAFADADARLSSVLRDNSQPSPEDCIVADEEDPVRAGGGRLRSSGGDPNGPPSRAPSAAPATDSDLHSYGSGISLDLGRPPPKDVAVQLFMSYFRNWHPFFPFLHGPAVGDDIETLYRALDAGQAAGKTPSSNPDERRPPLPLPRVIILQCVFNLASLHSNVDLPPSSRIDRTGALLAHLLPLTARGDILSIQALFAAQILLVARMSLRNAVVVAGLLSRAVFLAGLHRCPVRYAELTTEDSDIRKRVFWSIYVLDRFFSQALGHPLGIQDSDIDVCQLNGPELHRRPAPRLPVSDEDMVPTIPTTSPSTPLSHIRRSAAATSELHRNSHNDRPFHSETPSGERTNRHQILAFHVEYSRLCGRALEIFHKSIHLRSIDPSTVLSLRTDLEAWWNSLPSELQDFDPQDKQSPPPSQSSSDDRQDHPFSVPALFILLYNQLRLLIHRPWLSLEPSTPEFRSALQVCIGASRDIISNVRRQHEAKFGLFWPGYLSATWMSGIILAFACRLDLYPSIKGQREINICLDILAGLSKRWPLAKNCHTVLSDLQEIIRQNSESTKLPQEPTVMRHVVSYDETNQYRSRASNHNNPERPAKRVRISTDNQQGFTSEPQPLPSSRRSDHTEKATGETNTDCSQSDVIEQGHQDELCSHAAIPNGTTQSIGMAPLPNPMQGGDSNGFQWTNPAGFNGWDSGMPDILHGVTWESLLQTVNEENMDWGGSLL